MHQEYIYRFSAEKSAILKAKRGIGFDDVIYGMENGCLLDTIDHTSQKYPHQKMFVVEVNGYTYVVPFVQNGEEVFLKTIYPSRNMTKRYLGEKNEKN